MALDYKISVAILNWNGLSHLKTFLPSVVQHSQGAEVVVIDNASTDGSPDWVRNSYPGVRVEVLSENLGFTGGYNAGMEFIHSPFCVLLNSDVEVTPDWLSPLLELMEAQPDLAAVQPAILSWREKGHFEYAGAAGGFLDNLAYPFCRGRIFDTCEADEGQYPDSIPVFWATGACMMVRVADFREAGGFEPRFFAHMEEIELCWRFWERGKRVMVQPRSKVYHLGAGTLAKQNPKKTFLNFHNGLAMLFMHSSLPQIMWKIPLRLVLDGVAGIRFLLSGESANCWAISSAHMKFYSGLAYWWKKNRLHAKARICDVPKEVQPPISILWAYFVKGKKKYRDL